MAKLIDVLVIIYSVKRPTACDLDMLDGAIGAFKVRCIDCAGCPFTSHHAHRCMAHH